jgi:hypothetical protein
LGWSVTALAIGPAAPAQASCWSEADMDAAKVRDLQSRLMVADPQVQRRRRRRHPGL